VDKDRDKIRRMKSGSNWSRVEALKPNLNWD
jgi:hypothetical protein